MDGLSLEQAIQRLAAMACVQINVDRPALQKAKIKLSEPVYLHLRDVELRTAFANLYLRRRAVVAVERNGSIELTTMAELPTVVRVYDIGDLIETCMARRRVASSTSEEVPIHSAAIVDSPPTRAETIARLVEIIEANVQDSVRDLPSPAKRIVPILNGKIVGIGPETMQDDLQAFLNALQSSN